MFHARTKHIEVHNRFIKDRVLNGDMTNVPVVDIFIKAIETKKLRRFRAMLGVV